MTHTVPVSLTPQHVGILRASIPALLHEGSRPAALELVQLASSSLCPKDWPDDQRHRYLVHFSPATANAIVELLMLVRNRLHDAGCPAESGQLHDAVQDVSSAMYRADEAARAVRGMTALERSIQERARRAFGFAG
ncbi:hypothetical protein [Methylobacterium frigidaeris]|uniref:Uncharacterized protein n=1 Tax=Methylobacterium frigidaeris TaxID=2038277 RepID=A0AA37HJ46_9HYPH|nr:hypothetical protein [Methylobacterium frigidaeris]GJD66486.1 hypothetical protein MPEAHAMD_6684 [Methylobacterium frigidaeris]